MLGRQGGGADLVVPSDVVSRRHAVCRLTPEGALYIEDTSTNGTLVNGERLARNQMRRLHTGDRIGDESCTSTPGLAGPTLGPGSVRKPSRLGHGGILRRSQAQDGPGQGRRMRVALLALGSRSRPRPTPARRSSRSNSG